MEFGRRALRLDCDYITRIVNQIPRMRLGQRTDLQPGSSDVQEALELAALTDTVLQILDCYTYKNFRISVDGRNLELHGLKSQLEEASMWSTLRRGSRAFAELVSSPERITDVEEFAKTLHCEAPTFAGFLQSDAGSQVLAALQPIRKELARRLRNEVDELIDLNFVLKTRAGAFQASELLECWAVLSQLATAAWVWRKAFQQTGAWVLAIDQLSTAVASSLGCTVERSAELLSQFSLDSTHRNQDPFFRPLIRLNESEILLAGTFLETGRFSRNIFTIAIREAGVDFSPKGLKPLQELRREFLNAGYKVLLNLPIVTDEGVLTDVDIAVAKDGFLFIGQTKVLIHPDTVYDDWKVLENLKKAAAQLRKSLPHTSTVAGRVGLTDGEFVTVPFLLTNVWDFTGATIERFKVVDFSYLSQLLRGGEIWRIEPTPVPTREIRKLIAGRYPTGEELYKLLRRTFHEAMFERPQLEKRHFAVGDWTITVPVQVRPQPDADAAKRSAFAKMFS